MDIATLIGMVASAGIVLVSILLAGSLTAFIDVPSLVVVVGGTMCATLASESLKGFLGSIKVGLKALLAKPPSIPASIATIVRLSTVARREGLIALENEKIDDKFLARGVRLAVDGMQPEDIRGTLTDELIAMKARHKKGQQTFRFMAATAPSMGMIGTLIGLVQMLQTLDDPSKIGPAMAVALLTTFYGAILAFMIFTPLAEKLALRSNEEGANMAIIIEGMEAIVKGENARVIKDKLEGFLDPRSRTGDKADAKAA